MRSTKKQIKVFLDTSVILSGLNSQKGASRFILSLIQQKQITLAISPEVVIELERITPKKFPLLQEPLIEFLTNTAKLGTEKLTPDEIKKAHQLIPTEDAPILAGALKAKTDYLITLDKRFKKETEKNKVKETKVILPSEFVRQMRNRKKPAEDFFAFRKKLPRKTTKSILETISKGRS